MFGAEVVRITRVPPRTGKAHALKPHGISSLPVRDFFWRVWTRHVPQWACLDEQGPKKTAMAAKTADVVNCARIAVFCNLFASLANCCASFQFTWNH